MLTLEKMRGAFPELHVFEVYTSFSAFAPNGRIILPGVRQGKEK